MPDDFKAYLGDGVYAEYDGIQVWLSAEREDGRTHRIAVEPEVLQSLNAFYARASKAAADAERDAAYNAAFNKKEPT